MAGRSANRKILIALLCVSAVILLLNQVFNFGFSHLLTVAFALFLAAFMGFILLSAYNDKKREEDFERWKNIVEILAVLAAGVFFSIQFLNGWTSNNMSLHLETQRYRLDDQTDYVAVQVKLDKGEYGSVKLFTGEVRAIDPDNYQPLLGSEAKRLAATQRVTYKPGESSGTYGKDVIDWKEANDKPYRIASNDKVEFAAVLKVPKGATCIIEAVVITYADLWVPNRGPAQSRASVVSIPPELTKKEDKPSQ